jgi:hypothetical protein
VRSPPASRAKRRATRALSPHAAISVTATTLRPLSSANLSPTADAPFSLEDRASGERAEVRVAGASPVPPSSAAGTSLYREALAGHDVLERLTSDGIEGRVSFDRAPAEPHVRYDVTLSDAVAGLRLVEGTLELLDASGAPRLRMRRPAIEGADEKRVMADARLNGCHYDTSPAAPWGRAVTPPGSASCSIDVSWDSAIVPHPEVLVLSWSTTASLITARDSASASTIAGGRILAAGGGQFTPNGSACNGISLSSAELFDPVTRTWAATGPMPFFMNDVQGVALSTGDVLVFDPTYVSAGALYDTAAGTFTANTNAPSSAQDSGAFVAVPTGGALAIGGISGTNVVATTDFFDPTTNSWSTRASLTQGRGIFAAVPVVASTPTPGGYIMVVGGYTVSPLTPLTHAEFYDYAADMWWSSPTAAPVSGITTGAPDSTGDHVLYLGGTSTTGIQSAV